MDVSKVETCERFLDFLEYLIWTRELGLDPVEFISEFAHEIHTRKPRRRVIL